MNAVIETPRLIIRNFLPAEAEIYYNLFNDERVAEHLPKRTREERVKIFETMLANTDSGALLNNWAVCTKDTNEIIGTMLLRPFDGEEDKTEIGYAMLYDYWGKGLGTEMTEATIAYAFDKINTGEVVAVTTLENIASQKVLEKAGMVRLDNIDRDGLELAYFNIVR
jgi:ribosomal-protein-alanine N-acetyltransferase